MATSLQGQEGRVYEFDYKSMRKVEDNESIVMLVENELAGGMIVTFNFRMLFKMH